VGIAGEVAVIGPKKLSTIRKEIQEALAATGEDPIHRLDRQIAATKSKGQRADVMAGLKRFLETPPKRTRRKPRIQAKK
jgi:hypothetical protein